MEQDIRFCTTRDGINLAYATSGNGPPLVRVANWLTHLDLDWERFRAEVRSFIGSSEAETVADDPQEPFPELTPRECEVLDLIAHGLGNDEIAERLYISPKTVRNHNTRIFDKLQVDSRSRAIVLAREAGIGKG